MHEWKKLGLIFEPGRYDWQHTHAQNPLPEALGDGTYRVHFAARDAENRARGGYFDFNIAEPKKILNVSSSPTLDLGLLGTFDDSGVMPSSIVEVDGDRYLYYTGWSKAVTVPFSFHIGLAISRKSETGYRRFSDAPVLGRGHDDPYITAAPYVIREGDLFRMWYISGTGWTLEGNEEKPRHYYTIKHAKSKDGISWQTSRHLCIEYREKEYAVARPVVFMDGDTYRMWFTFRGGSDTYRIGSATSSDGIHWDRDRANVNIATSSDGWDSEMICYAHPLEYEGQIFALYNGNGYGRTGVGLAVWVGET